MVIGIMSDSHDHIENTKKALKLFEQKQVSHILHLGDFVSPFMVKLFNKKVIAIFGNNDGDHFRILTCAKEVGATIAGEFYEFEEHGCRIAMYHGTQSALTQALIECGRYDLVTYGHTHVVDIRMHNKTQVVNPGTVHGFSKTPTVALFDCATKKIESLTL